MFLKTIIPLALVLVKQGGSICSTIIWTGFTGKTKQLFLNNNQIIFSHNSHIIKTKYIQQMLVSQVYQPVSNGRGPFFSNLGVHANGSMLVVL